MPYTDHEHDRALAKLAADIDKTKISKGPVEVTKCSSNIRTCVVDCERRMNIADVVSRGDGDAAVRADASLIADAFNTFTATGLTPSELVEQKWELVAALQRTLSWLTSYPGGGTLGPGGPYEQARSALAKATETPQ